MSAEILEGDEIFTSTPRPEVRLRSIKGSYAAGEKVKKNEKESSPCVSFSSNYK